MKSSYLWSSLAAVVIFASCKKEKGGTITPPLPDSTFTKEDLVKDTAIDVARGLYLWNTQIPDSFNARSYGDPDAIMKGIRRYSKETGFIDPVDHYSFAAKKVDWDNISSGIAQDFGLNIFFREDGDLRVRMVEPLSPAGLAGIHRGWKLTKINGNTNMTIANADFIVENIYNSSNSTITFLKPDGNAVDLSLSAGTYTETPVYLDSVYTVGAKKVGYLRFTSFLGDVQAVTNRLQQVFGNFVDKGVTDVIVDLRYNGGGYVSLSETLANYLVKTSAEGKNMMTQNFNANNPNLNETTKFSKKGTLNISNIDFIVDGNTASASELLINNLKPYMVVNLIGATTYGKPVGFFPYDDGDWYLFPISFITTNSLGEGHYFKGIAAQQDVEDGLDKDFGDITELRLAAALHHITTGTFGFAGRGTGLSSTLATQVNEVNKNKLIGKNAFIGAVGAVK